MERETLLRRLAAVLSAGAAVIHGVVIGPHFEEYVWFGIFFVAVTVFQAVWAALALTRLSKALYRIAIIGNAAIIVTWAWSRTAGIPIGPEPGVAEPPGVRDGLSVAFELLVVVLCIAVRSRWALGAVARGTSLVTTVAAIVVVATLTAVAVVSPHEEQTEALGSVAPSALWAPRYDREGRTAQTRLPRLPLIVPTDNRGAR